jgi:hemerythrin-like domain-containing protein
MKPRGTLMIEHRLIEKMLNVIRKEEADIRSTKMVDPVFIDTAVDFIRTYADRTHHGKEEDILFRDLDKKKMTDEDAAAMRGLIEEHAFARKTVAGLVEAKMNYVEGDRSAIDTILEKLGILMEFYPSHILKEDRVFFPNTEKYFTADELDAMLNEFREFDMRMIHEKYQRLVLELESRRGMRP